MIKIYDFFYLAKSFSLYNIVRKSLPRWKIFTQYYTGWLNDLAEQKNHKFSSKCNKIKNHFHIWIPNTVIGSVGRNLQKLVAINISVKCNNFFQVLQRLYLFPDGTSHLDLPPAIPSFCKFRRRKKQNWIELVQCTLSCWSRYWNNLIN